MIPEPAGSECRPDSDHCITCGDEGVPMRVVRVDGQTAACVDRELAIHEVAVDLVAPVATGDLLLVHAGVAIAGSGAGR